MVNPNLGVASQFIADSVSVVTNTEEGVTKVPDPVKIMHRVMQIDSNNYASFLQRLYRLRQWADGLINHMVPRAAIDLRDAIYHMTEPYIIGVTGKSSEKGGQFLAKLMENKDERVISISDANKKSGILDTLGRLSGGDREPDTGAVT